MVGALAYIMIYLYVPQEFPGMRHGMGAQINIWIPVVIVPVTFMIGLLAYLFIFPDIEQKPSTETTLPREQRSLEAVLRVLKDDEKKVVELLMNAGGKMLQRDISRKTGFTRVKTHRILYRLSTRGIVTAKKYYNTYQIALADWLL
ncbi:MAG: hypothetical protein H3Z50_03870 [archaeon]|nr:hypothetical protein [archaeon]MCP8306599.1 hypothetical protein [archaeon]